MNPINSVSLWASRHPSQAIPLIIVMELTNVLIGLMVGSALLQENPPWVLMAALTGLGICHVNLRRYTKIRVEELPSPIRFHFQKRAFFGLFCLNLMGYTLAGGILGHMATQPEGTNNLYGSLSSATEISSEKALGEKKISFREKMRQKALRRTMHPRLDTVHHRVGYFLLFLAGVFLSFSGAYLACSLACGGYGLWAALVILLSIGVLAGGIYFLIRMVDRNMKPFRDMTRDERKREGRRYLWTLLGTAGGLGLLLLISSLTN